MSVPEPKRQLLHTHLCLWQPLITHLSMHTGQLSHTDPSLSTRQLLHTHTPTQTEQLLHMLVLTFVEEPLFTCVIVNTEEPPHTCYCPGGGSCTRVCHTLPMRVPAHQAAHTHASAQTHGAAVAHTRAHPRVARVPSPRPVPTWPPGTPPPRCSCAQSPPGGGGAREPFPARCLPGVVVPPRSPPLPVPVAVPRSRCGGGSAEEAHSPFIDVAGEKAGGGARRGSAFSADPALRIPCPRLRPPAGLGRAWGKEGGQWGEDGKDWGVRTTSPCSSPRPLLWIPTLTPSFLHSRPILAPHFSSLSPLPNPHSPLPSAGPHSGAPSDPTNPSWTSQPCPGLLRAHLAGITVT